MNAAGVIRLLGEAEIYDGFHIGRLNVGIGRVFEVGPTVPPGATVGYSAGAIFIDTDATGAGNVTFINEGSMASSDFQPIST